MREKSKKIYAGFFVLVLLISFIGNNFFVVEARTNEKYSQYIQSTDGDLDQIIASSTVLDYIGSFIYALGNIVEHVTSNLMNVANIGKYFPWSDLIVFNAIPLLDVNFINPDPNSLLADSSTNSVSIGDVIRNVYFTGLSIALGFLGIIVAVMAIKLALSTLASEKAKYKEAIVKWLTALVLLFGMHFVLSFLFYMNEILVEKASEILISTMQESGKKVVENLKQNVEGQEEKIVENFVSAAEPGIWDSIVQGIRGGVLWSINPVCGGISVVQNILGAVDGAVSSTTLTDHTDITYALISNSTIRKNVIPSVDGNKDADEGWLGNVWNFLTETGSELWNGMTQEQKEIGVLASYVEVIAEANNENLNQYQEALSTIADKLSNHEYDGNDEKTELEVMQVVMSYAVSYAKGESLQSSNEDTPEIITLLGEYFKNTAWYTDVDNGGWSPDQISIISAILYTMLVFQSIGFFISYVKRLVIVVVLAVFAPFVVIYDFFTKSLAL